MADTHIRSVHGVQIMQRRHRIIRALEKAAPRPLVFGTQVWRSSFTMMSYLETQPITRSARVVEVGCGWGLVGIFCAKRFGARVLLTDVDKRVFPYARAHGALNDVHVTIEHIRMERLSNNRLGDTDVILGSDICFWPELGTALRGLVARALDRGVRRVVLADPGRSTFLRLADYCQARFPSELMLWPTETRTKTETYLLVVGRGAA
jgi:predicted nicotinamide N-methyase